LQRCFDSMVIRKSAKDKEAQVCQDTHSTNIQEALTPTLQAMCMT